MNALYAKFREMYQMTFGEAPTCTDEDLEHMFTTNGVTDEMTIMQQLPVLLAGAENNKDGLLNDWNQLGFNLDWYAQDKLNHFAAHYQGDRDKFCREAFAYLYYMTDMKESVRPYVEKYADGANYSDAAIEEACWKHSVIDLDGFKQNIKGIMASLQKASVSITVQQLRDLYKKREGRDIKASDDQIDKFISELRIPKTARIEVYHEAVYHAWVRQEHGA